MSDPTRPAPKRCQACGFDLPPDWPPTAEGPVLCVPCSRPVVERTGPMTPVKP